jgi:hypothetical protein
MSEFLLHAVELLPNGKNGLRSTSARKVRAAEIRAQRLDRAQACGETAVHAPQSSAAGSGGVAGTVALEQFPRLLVWRSRAGGSKQMGRPQNEDTSPPPKSEVYSGGRCGQATSRKPREVAHPQFLLVNKPRRTQFILSPEKWPTRQNASWERLTRSEEVRLRT